MKKIFTTLVIAILMVAAPAQAQLKFGLTGGLNFTNMSYSENALEDAASNKTGFFVGPTASFTLPIVGLGIDASALYDQRSSEYDTGSGSKETIKTQTIQVPVNVRYGIGLGSMASVFVFAGPQFGFNIGDKSKSLVEGASEWTMKSSNLSANIGIGAMALSHLQVKLNYNIALGKTGEVEMLDAATGAVKSVLGDAKANAWQLSIAYLF